MHSLRELQLAFLDAVLANVPERALPLLRTPAGAADVAAARAGLGVYADNVVATAAHALELGFPTVLALGGRDWFAGCVSEYVRAHPSRSGDLHARGERFPAFLTARLGGGPYAYFADVARLERAYQEVIVAAAAPPLDLAALAAVPADRHAELVFVAHPAARVVASPWPILEVWRAHRGRTAAGPGAGDGAAPAADTAMLDVPATDAPVDLGAGPQQVLVIRRTDHVELSACTPGAALLHHAFGAGRSLGEVVEALGESFPLTAALTELAGRGALAGFTLGPVDRPPQPPVLDTA